MLAPFASVPRTREEMFSSQQIERVLLDAVFAHARARKKRKTSRVFRSRVHAFKIVGGKERRGRLRRLEKVESVQREGG